MQNSDVGQYLEVGVTASNESSGGGQSDIAYSSAVGPVPAPAASSTPPTNLTDVPVVLPSITGNPKVGSPLTVSSGEWSNPVAVISYQWQDCTASGCANIAGATGATFTPTPSLVGSTLQVVVTATAAGRSVTVTTSATAPVQAAAPASPAPPKLTAAQAAAAALAALGIRLGSASHISSLIHHGLSAIVHCTAACKVVIALEATSKDRGLKGTIGGVSARIRAGQTQIVVATVSHRDVKAVDKLSSLYLSISFEIVEGHSTRRDVYALTIKR